MKADGLVKQEHILEAAIKRFSHFGVNKTTLAEIADDLAVSKPSLSYYFSDKTGLITAVAKKILNEFLETTAGRFQSATSVEEGLRSLIETKRLHFKKYFLLAVQAEAADLAHMPPELSHIYREAQTAKVALLATLFQKGIAAGELRPMDIEKVSEVILYALSAFEHGIQDRGRLPELAQIDELFDKQRELVTIIYNGLKKV